MNQINMKNYIKPEVSLLMVDLTSFLCASVREMTLTIEVDEYENQEDVLVFDSDY